MLGLRLRRSQEQDILPPAVRSRGERAAVALRRRSGVILRSLHHRVYSEVFTYYIPKSNASLTLQQIEYVNDELKQSFINFVPVQTAYMMEEGRTVYQFSIYMLITAFRCGNVL